MADRFIRPRSTNNCDWAIKDLATMLRQKRSRLAVTDRAADWISDAPEFLGDPLFNLLDWGSNNLIAIAIGNAVRLCNAPDAASTSDSVSYRDALGSDDVIVTSLRWSEDGQHIAVGLSNHDVQLWKVTAGSISLLRTLHLDSVIGSIDWNGNLVTTGGAGGKIVTNDARMPSPVLRVFSYRGWNNICALKWNNSRKQLASGTSDGLIRIWDATLSKPSHVLGTAGDSSYGSRALAWCPFSDDLLASGAEGTISFWNTCSGTCVNSHGQTQTGNNGSKSQVSALLWDKNNGREILSSSGNGDITLWDYPSMDRKARLVGHHGSVLSLCGSPDGCSVASVSGGVDKSIRVWFDVFSPKPKPAAKRRAFSDYYRTEIR